MSPAVQDTLETAAAPHRVLGRRVIHLAETTSTMDEVARLAATAEPEGAVVIADRQTAGRGRHGRRWASRAGADLLLSVLVRPRPAVAHELPIISSLACANVAGKATGAEIQIKWPNDVLSGGSKLAGIIAESTQDAEGICVVLGIGLNVNSQFRDSADAPNATSLSTLAGRSLSRVEVLSSLLDEVDEMYAALRAGQTLIPEWRDRLTTIGERVQVSSVDPRAPGVLVEGIAVDVDDRGRLIVEGDDGLARAVSAGEVTLRNRAGWKEADKPC